MLTYDPDVAVAELARVDSDLAAFMEVAGPCRIAEREWAQAVTSFEALARSIVYQQLSGKAAGTIYGRFVDLFDGAGPTPEELLTLSEEQLRGCGLSRNKMLAVRDLAEKRLDGTVLDRTGLQKLSDEEVLQRLTAVRGIGPWTVQMLLMFYLGRPDVLPTTDLGIQKGFRLVYGTKDLPSPKELEAHGEQWKPWRTVASWYMWEAVHIDRGETT
ncbi:MAG: DNA-3-methyladenine glycosylase [Rubricoccaceae bacterium]|nr:DNA-3-methyladenine glycosylase [Rubricoccaceae bacterium]